MRRPAFAVGNNPNFKTDFRNSQARTFLQFTDRVIGLVNCVIVSCRGIKVLQMPILPPRDQWYTPLGISGTWCGRRGAVSSSWLLDSRKMMWSVCHVYIFVLKIKYSKDWGNNEKSTFVYQPLALFFFRNVSLTGRCPGMRERRWQRRTRKRQSSIREGARRTMRERPDDSADLSSD